MADTNNTSPGWLDSTFDFLKTGLGTYLSYDIAKSNPSVITSAQTPTSGTVQSTSTVDWKKWAIPAGLIGGGLVLALIFARR